MFLGETPVGVLHTDPTEQQKQYDTSGEKGFNHLSMPSNARKPHEGKR